MAQEIVSTVLWNGTEEAYGIHVYFILAFGDEFFSTMLKEWSVSDSYTEHQTGFKMHTATPLSPKHAIQLDSEWESNPTGLASTPPIPGGVWLLNYFSKTRLPPQSSEAVQLGAISCNQWAASRKRKQWGNALSFWSSHLGRVNLVLNPRGWRKLLGSCYIWTWLQILNKRSFFTQALLSGNRSQEGKVVS